MDFAARWGGEEFIYGAFNSSAEEIEGIAEAIRSMVYNLKVPHKFSEKWVYVTVSIGICTLKVNGKVDVSKCIEGADKALYSAKSQGRNCVRVFVPS